MSTNANTSEVWNLGDDIEGRWPRLRRFPFASIIFGVLAPMACLVLEPGAAQILNDMSNGDGDQLLTLGYRLFGYCMITLEILVLVLHITMRRRLGVWNSLVAGVLGVGAMFAALHGAVLLPLSILGLLVVIGILGFVPFATAIVFAINGRGALIDAIESAGWMRVLCLVIIGALLSIGVPVAAQWPVTVDMESALERTANGDPVDIKPFERWTPVKSRVWELWRRETNPERKECFDQAYKRLTGITASERQQRIDDD